MPATDPRVTALVDTYCAAWNETDATRRAALLGAVWAPGATYSDPGVDALGQDQLVAHIGRLQQARTGASIHRTSEVDTHHRVARFHWHLRNADGTALPEGIDFVDLTDDGRIARIVGFFGPLRSSAQSPGGPA